MEWLSFSFDWLKTTLQQYPEMAVFLSLAIGYWVGAKVFKGFSLGAVTSTLLAALLIGQLDITISATVKNIFFLMFLFAIGYGIGPQFVRGIAKDGLPQAVFALVQCVFCLGFPILAAIIAGYDLGSAAGLFAGSQTISASMGLATDAINRLGLPSEETTQMLNAMPVAYAVTYMFGTVGSALLLSIMGPKLLRFNLPEECRKYEQSMGGANMTQELGDTAWHEYELRSYRVLAGSKAVGMCIKDLEASFPNNRVFVEGLRRAKKIIPTTYNLVIEADDVLAIGGDHAVIVEFLGDDRCYDEVEDKQLLQQPMEGVDVLITNKEVNGKTLEELAHAAQAHGVFLRRIKRGAAGNEIPILPKTKIYRGDVLTLSGLTKDVENAIKALGTPDRKTNMADVSFIGGAIFIGTVIGAMVVHVGTVPLTLSTAGGALIAGLVFGWLRSIHPTFGRIPESTVWFMNSVGLNVFIAVIGISAGPSFVAGLEKIGISLFLWGIFATCAPLICGMFAAKYIFRFHPAILLGCCAGARTTTAALGMICERAGSNIPSIGYTITYAVGNTVLTIWGMVIIMLLS